jgi:ligand-binding sensor domain-containing protein
MKKRGVFLLVVVGMASARLQGAGEWRSYTSMKEVRDVASTETMYWVATSGGLFAYEDGSSTFQAHTNAEGLLSNDLTAVTADVDGRIWVGTSTGVVQALLAGGSWQPVLDIAESQQTSKRINRFIAYGDTLLICTEFGLSMYDADQFLFGDTYTKFGSLTNVRVSVSDAIIFEDSIWAVVSDLDDTHRIAVAALSNPNRLPPESWSLRSVGVPATKPTTLSVFGGRLYAGTVSGLYYRAGSSWIGVAGLAGKNVVATTESDASLVACTPTQVFVVNADNTVLELATPPDSTTSVAVGGSGQPAVGSKTEGLLTYDGNWISRFPNGPNSNQFLSVAVDPEGNVWGASGIINGKGLYRFDGNTWVSFTRENSPLPTDNYYRVSVGCDGSVWASSWGWGIVEMLPGSTSVDTTRIYSNNVGMQGLAVDPDFVVVTDVVCDPAGNTWMSVNQALDTKILAVRKADGIWETVPLKFGATRINTLFYNVPLDHALAVDAFGNLWGGSRNTIYKGVFSLFNAGQVEDSAEVLLTEQNGLPSNEITTVVVDRDNDLWVGTDRGIGIILDPLDPKGPGGIALYQPLNGIVVNSIAVDALNQKWVGTPEGVILLSPDGIQQLASYTVENTGGKLIDNDVKSIAIDNRTGTVYFGTAVGLSSLETTAAAPKDQFERLEISPNPYVIPSEVPLTVDGLVENSVLKILTIDGRLVREIPSPGGRIGFWDGRDEDGEPVASGIYVIVAYSSDGSRITAAKAAVIRR